MPVGLALHPFFNRSDNTHARLSARRIWRPPFAADEAGRETQAPAFIEAHSLQTLPADEFDNTLLSAAQPIVVETPAGAIALKANVDDWHVYAPRGERFFCIEPVTQLPGAFGARIIEPQETAALALSFSPSRDY